MDLKVAVMFGPSLREEHRYQEDQEEMANDCSQCQDHRVRARI